MSVNRRNLFAFEGELSAHFDVTNLEKLGSFLNVTFVLDKEGGWITQQHYILQTLERFGMSKCKAVANCMCQGAIKQFGEPSEAVDRNTYQELLGGFSSISTRTRPDISAAVSLLCRFSANMRRSHWVTLKRVLQYLRGDTEFDLFLSRRSEEVLTAFCDAI